MTQNGNSRFGAIMSDIVEERTAASPKFEAANEMGHYSLLTKNCLIPNPILIMDLGAQFAESTGHF